ncbi:hypothetical protein [Gramella sp. KN1008]|uniref:hypothetical protein n=1 Tax=Gramella sp. KN1008 TaxID=2529298 RepID=UPI00104008DD|nr:hypothetical protein [Gramella sp. KN1008]TBW28276.1 hypothetical protein EZJ28_05885 [Gramella sp. KN1008]
MSNADIETPVDWEKSFKITVKWNDFDENNPSDFENQSILEEVVLKYLQTFNELPKPGLNLATGDVDTLVVTKVAFGVDSIDIFGSLILHSMLELPSARH